MLRFYITVGYSNCSVTRTYEVCAETEEEAKQCVQDGTADCIDEQVDLDREDDPSDWDISCQDE